MKINLHRDSESSKNASKFMVSLVQEMLADYNMKATNDNLFYFAEDEGAVFFCNWAKEKKGIVAKPFKFQSDSKVLAFGFELEENQFLTAELLKNE